MQLQNVMVFGKIKNWIGGRRQESTSQTYAEQMGKRFADSLFKQYCGAHKDNPKINKEDLHAVTSKVGEVIAALGDERVKLLVEHARTTGSPAINTSISVGKHAGDFLMVSDLNVAGD